MSASLTNTNGRFRENYRMQAVDVDTTVNIVGDTLGGFLCKTSGTITVTDNGDTVVDAVPVTAGGYYPVPGQLSYSSSIATFATAGGASGTLFT